MKRLEKLRSSPQRKGLSRSAARGYYNQVLSVGHTAENALAYTRQHHPYFVPSVAEAVAAPVMNPVSLQPVPVAQPVAQPACWPSWTGSEPCLGGDFIKY